ncbi:MAG TPA: hypothetical protein VNY73_04135 [Bacteroidia bacterium]|jgi:hypothetical protein|nr:hypothetical protein [Bacteroidia bacterium]
MATNHTTSIEIKDGINSQEYFAFEQPNKLIVFVHGFGGGAISTWNNFSSMLLMDNDFAKSDIIFYGYDTLKGQAGDHSAEFYHFLEKALAPVANDLLPPGQQLNERNYDSILIIAHSLGSVIVRQALLLANTDKKKWVAKTSMALFAPAHIGANVISLAMEALPGLWNLVGVFARYKYPILNDLNPKESEILKIIKEKSAKLQESDAGEFTKAKLVVYAKGDKVVKNVQYLEDKPAEVMQNKTHTTVCKPTEEYKNPVIFIKQLI